MTRAAGKFCRIRLTFDGGMALAIEVFYDASASVFFPSRNATVFILMVGSFFVSVLIKFSPFAFSLLCLSFREQLS